MYAYVFVCVLWSVYPLQHFKSTPGYLGRIAHSLVQVPANTKQGYLSLIPACLVTSIVPREADIRHRHTLVVIQHTRTIDCVCIRVSPLRRLGPGECVRGYGGGETDVSDSCM